MQSGFISGACVTVDYCGGPPSPAVGAPVERWPFGPGLAVRPFIRLHTRTAAFLIRCTV